jgi:serine/threonine protein phosphatase 1
MKKCCIIGDIHGCLTSLVYLLKKIPAKIDSFIFLGDYIDRGPDTKKVLDSILDLKQRHPHVICLLGNHELMLLNFLAYRDDGRFLDVGGKQTLESYGLPVNSSPTQVKAAIPPEHLAFLHDLPLLWENQYAFFVHAGLQPGVHSSRQTRNWCLWSRDNFIRSTHDFGKPVVFGHTVFNKPLVQKNKIGIDTGAVYGQSLTALLLPDMEFISVPGETKNPYPFR